MRILLTLIISVLFLSFIKAQTYSDADNAIDNKDYSTALDIAQKLMDKDSTDQALKILVQLKEKDYQLNKVLEKIGDIYNKMRVSGLALSNYKDAEKLDSANIQLRFKIAKVLYREKQYTDAANEYLRIISIDSTYLPAYQSLGDLLYYAKQYGNAAFYLEKYLRSGKTLDEFIFAAQSYYNINNFKKTLELSEDGLSSFPGNNTLLKLKAASLLFLNNYDEALKTYNLLPDSLFSAQEYARIGKVFQSVSNDSIAYIFLKKAYQKDSSLTDIYLDLGNLNLKSKNFERALYFYNKRISSDPSSLSSYVNAALCLIQLQRYNEATSYLSKALSQKSDYMPAKIWMARNYRMMDSTQKAFDVYSDIIQITKGKENDFKTEVSEAYGNLGYKNLLRKNYPAAIENLKSAVLYSPSSAQYHLWLAEAYALNGKKAEAVKEYKEVLAIEPGNKDAIKGIKLISE
jgi:tetratricopeptide (TPR) repeat protein